MDWLENASRAAVVVKISDWWSEFVRAQGKLLAFLRQDARGEFDLPAWMNEHLQAIHPDICWEFGPGRRGAGYQLILTPEVNHSLEPLVREILRRAPQTTDFEFGLYRVSETPETAAALVAARCGGSLDGGMAKVCVGQANLIDVAFHLPDRRGDQRDVEVTTLIAAESLLGEENLHFWVGQVQEDPRRSGRGWVTLDRLKDTFEAVKGSIRGQLPSRPVWATGSDGDGVVLSRELSGQAADYSAMDDVILASLTKPSVVPALLEGRTFHSERFSRFGELFAYLKMDFTEVDRAEFVQARSVVEDDLHARLAPERVGGVWGSAAGFVYAYTLLALNDVPRAVEIVRDVARRHGVHRRSWVLFIDSRLTDEWFGIYPDTPYPPGAAT